MTRIVKVYLNHGTKQQEIRRFPYDEGLLTYGELESKIRVALPSVRGKRFKLFWKDAENDMIAFSSQEELNDALRNKGKDMLRVFVKVKDVKH